MTKFTDVLLQHGRALEWLTSVVLFAFALTLWMPGDTLASSPSFGGFIAAGMDEAMLTGPLMFIAAIRMAGLVINGSWRRSPIFRMVGAILGTMIFSFLGFMFALPYFAGMQSALSTGAGIYTVLAIFDAIAAYRSGADVRAYPKP